MHSIIAFINFIVWIINDYITFMLHHPFWALLLIVSVIELIRVIDILMDMRAEERQTQ